MPCRSDWDDSSYYERLRDENDKLTKMLCACCKSIDERSGTVPPIAGAWWKQHREADARREREERERREREALRATALKKLTAEEKKALGL